MNARQKLLLTLSKGGGASAASLAPYPAPSGYAWVFVYEAVEGSDRVEETPGDPAIELVAA